MSRLRTAVVWVALVVLALIAIRLAEPEAPRARDHRDLAVASERATAAAGAPTIQAEAVAAMVAADTVGALIYGMDGTLYVRSTEDQWFKLATDDASRRAWSDLAQAGTAMEPLEEVAQGDTGQPMLHLGSTLGSAFAPVLLVLGLVVFFVWWLRRRQQQQAGTLLQMRRSPARTLESPSHLKFSDVGGLEPIKERLQDVIDLLRNPDAWARAGVRPPRGVLLEGPPGCGKTLLARAVAGEAGVPVFVMSATDLVEMFVGVGAARVRDTFETARKAAPAVLFIDEIDAIGRRRGAGASALTHGELEQTLNQLLVNLDGAERAQGKQALLVVMAATNRADILDPALLRPGRFDLRLTVTPPELEGRRAILGVHTRRLPLDASVDLDALAASSAGATGAELELACNEAAVQAARRGIRKLGSAQVTAADLEAGLRGARRVIEGFTAVDALLVESAGQLARPRGDTPVRLRVEGEEPLEGRLVWADPAWIKLAFPDGAERLIPKARLLGVEALAGAGPADPAALRPPPGPATAV